MVDPILCARVRFYLGCPRIFQWNRRKVFIRAACLSPMTRIPLFPERYGFAVPVGCTETEPLPRELRNALWNAYCKCTGAGSPSQRSNYITFCAVVWTDLMHKPIDEFQSHTWLQAQKFVKDTFYSHDWMHVYAIIEFTFIHFVTAPFNKANLQKTLNEQLSDYSSAFRIVGDRFAPISEEEQFREVERALEMPLKPVKEHLKNAVRSLRDPSPTAALDCTRESIHAVEPLCKILTREPNDSLGEAFGVRAAILLSPGSFPHTVFDGLSLLLDMPGWTNLTRQNWIFGCHPEKRAITNTFCRRRRNSVCTREYAARSAT